MKSKVASLESRLRIAGALVFAGLAVELVSLLWSHPTAFILFLLPGVPLMAIGVIIYLYSIVSIKEPSGEAGV